MHFRLIGMVNVKTRSLRVLTPLFSPSLAAKSCLLLVVRVDNLFEALETDNDVLLLKNPMGSAGFEPATSAMSRRRHNQLDHEPCSTLSDLFIINLLSSELRWLLREIMELVNVYRRSCKLLDIVATTDRIVTQQPYGPHHPLLETGEAFPCAIGKKPKNV